MFTKTLVPLLVVVNIIYVECRPDIVVPPTEAVKQNLLRNELFNNLIQQIWQQISAQYANQGTGQVTQPTDVNQPPISSPPNGGGGVYSSRYRHYGSPQIDEEFIRKSIFNSETFNTLIQQILTQVSAEYANYITSRPPQSGSPPVVQAPPPVPPPPPSIYGNYQPGQYSQPIGIANHNKEAIQNARYSFLTEVNDNINGNYQFREESRQNGKTVGSFSYDDGYIFRTVHYEADGQGFRIISENTQPSKKAKETLDGTVYLKSIRDGKGGQYKI